MVSGEGLGTPPVFDPGTMLATLLGRKVRFVVIGGMAALAHGSPFPTEDLDITPDAVVANLTRLSTALTALAARVRAAGAEEGLPFAHDAESLGQVNTWNLTTRAGDLDLSLVPAGTQGYPDLAREASIVTAFGVAIPVASLADVVRSKQAANRPKDQRVLPTLRALLARDLPG